MLYIFFSVWLKTGSNPQDSNRFRSHAGKKTYLFISKKDNDHEKIHRYGEKAQEGQVNTAGGEYLNNYNN